MEHTHEQMTQLPEDFGDKLKQMVASASELEKIIPTDEEQTLGEIMAVKMNVRSTEAQALWDLSRNKNNDQVRATIQRVPGSDDLEIMAVVPIIKHLPVNVTLFNPSEHAYQIELSPEATLMIKFKIDSGIELFDHSQLVQEIYTCIDEQAPGIEQAISLFSDILYNHFIKNFEMSIIRNIPGGTDSYSITVKSQ